MKVLIIIPAYNEQDNIERVVKHLTENYPEYDYVVINDGSMDKTSEICHSNHYNIIDLPVNLGLAGGFQTGMKYALRHGYSCAVQFDADGQHRPEFLSVMAQVMRASGADIVIGSRFVSEKKDYSARMIGSRLISSIIRMTTGQVISDPTSGLRMFNHQMIEKFASDCSLSPEPETIAYLMRRGASVSEVQVSMRERVAGESYLSLSKSVAYMVRACTSILFAQWFRG